MSHDRAVLTAVFLLGGAAGSAVTFSFAVARERWRRIRRDIKTAKSGLKTLRKMVRREARTLVTTGAVVVLALVAAIVLVVAR